MSQFKQKPLRRERKFNNRKAPRMVQAPFRHVLINKELFKQWKKETGNKEITFAQFRQIWNDLCIDIYDVCTTNPFGFRMPFYTGDLMIKYVVKYAPALDEEASNQLGKELEHLNWNSNEKVGKIVWTIDYARKFNKDVRLIAFRPDRAFMRKASQALKETPEIFLDSKVSAKFIGELNEIN